MAMPTPRPKPRLYFAYGSNLSLTQMGSRCPTSTYQALALLKGYRWIIETRGYANVIPSPSDYVYGLLYTLQPEDEASLDRAEGVPWAYQKEMLEVEIVGSDGREVEGGEGGWEKVEVLVYVDGMRKEEGVINEEYIGRMERGIRDAIEKGMPVEYVERVLRRWIKVEVEGSKERGLGVMNP